MATTPYPFVANAILTASQLNSTFNIPVSAKTASYVLTAADAGTRVTMSSASATTITVNTSLFAAGDNLEITNIGAGVCTITAGTATVSTSGTLALVANAGGTLYFTSAGVSVFIASGVTASAGGLVFISANTVTASSSVSINNCFTSTYQNYRILFAPSASTGTDPVATIRLRASATDSTTTYRNERVGGFSSTAYASANPSGTDDWFIGPYDASAATSASFAIEMFSPNEARATSMSVITYGVENSGTQDITIIGGSHTTASAFDGFTLISGGTNITGIIYVYGYAKA